MYDGTWHGFGVARDVVCIGVSVGMWLMAPLMCRSLVLPGHSCNITRLRIYSYKLTQTGS